MKTPMKPALAVPLCFTITLSLASAAFAAEMKAPEVPPAVAVPAGHTPAMVLKGIGMLTYECRAGSSAADPYGWIFKAPDATLHDMRGMEVGRYYGGPTWAHRDGSTITGRQLAVASAGVDAIPLQLVQAGAATGAGVFSDVTFIQRLDTVGGVAPSTACGAANAGEQQTVGYSANYVFFKR